jgi:curved DNA-binding protein CbpA
MADYYKTLGVDRTASDAAIKTSFRSLAKRFHPDLNPGNASAEAAFKALNEAYTVLSDPVEREKYNGSNRWAGVPKVSTASASPASSGWPGGKDAWGSYLREEASHERAAQHLRAAAARAGGSPFAEGGAGEYVDRHEGWEARRAARVAASEAAAATAAARGASETGHYRAFAGQWRARQSSGATGLLPALLLMAVLTTVALQATGSLSSSTSRRRA